MDLHSQLPCISAAWHLAAIQWQTAQLTSPMVYSWLLQPVSFASLALTAATGGALLMYYNHMMEQKLKKSEVILQSPWEAL